MERLLKLGLVGLAFATTACGDPLVDNLHGPISETALTGTIEGKRFTGRIAIARSAALGREVTIYDHSLAGCSDPIVLEEGELSIELTVAPWHDGARYRLTIFDDPKTIEYRIYGGMPDGIIIGGGLVEVISSGDAGTRGMIALRGVSDEHGTVEGRVPVIFCD